MERLYFVVSFAEPDGDPIVTYQVDMFEPSHRKWWEVNCRAIMTRQAGRTADKTLGSRDGRTHAKQRILKHLQDHHVGLNVTVGPERVLERPS